MLVHYNFFKKFQKSQVCFNQMCTIKFVLKNISFKLKTLGKINMNRTRLVQILIFAQENWILQWRQDKF
jgi:hypothetical protein